jgi:hypothetical protein
MTMALPPKVRAEPRNSSETIPPFRMPGRAVGAASGSPTGVQPSTGSTESRRGRSSPSGAISSGCGISAGPWATEAGPGIIRTVPQPAHRACLPARPSLARSGFRHEGFGQVSGMSMGCSRSSRVVAPAFWRARRPGHGRRRSRQPQPPAPGPPHRRHGAPSPSWSRPDGVPQGSDPRAMITPTPLVPDARRRRPTRPDRGPSAAPGARSGCKGSHRRVRNRASPHRACDGV